MADINDLVARAVSDDTILEELISMHTGFILKCASKVSGRYITTSDDEWSMSLLAYTEAVKSFNSDKGNFFSFAELVIKRRLVDNLRSNQKYTLELSVDPTIFSGDTDDDNQDYAMKSALAEKTAIVSDDSLKYEIESANEAFATYGFTFFDLTSCSPKAEKTKLSCAKAVAYIIRNPIIVSELSGTKQLHLKIIEKNADVPRKILERHRKYIIAAVIILTGDYPYLAEYMHTVRKELEK